MADARAAGDEKRMQTVELTTGLYAFGADEDGGRTCDTPSEARQQVHVEVVQIVLAILAYSVRMLERFHNARNSRQRETVGYCDAYSFQFVVPGRLHLR
ncbi:hypothetical protein LMG29542_08213 [Paraburkholderia humisilvae]|uniref:Uncharacterized protein n=1 Tax=Paraburkholderia humisilvae TaxID=627669 RepID=A0A6J5FAI6_9BURK|nr:hypothetical protein LMG29542_08213 [Paraburkholderia humisilvae]